MSHWGPVVSQLQLEVGELQGDRQDLMFDWLSAKEPRDLDKFTTST